MRTRLLCATAALALLGTPSIAGAQDTEQPATDESEATDDAAASNDDGSLGTIVVTAQRREETLGDVPVSVSVLNNESLETTGVTGLSNITVGVPSLSAENINGYLGLHLRGVGSNGNGPGFENPVALYIDGVYLGNQTVGLLEFNNVERIEVLKGPQGTLFGRNATGGLVHIITEDPNSNTDIRARLSYGNRDAVAGDLYLSTPLGDDLAMDFAVRGSRHDGYGTNQFDGRDSYNLDHDMSLRSKMVYRPGVFKFTLIGDYYDRQSRYNSLTLYEGTRPAPGAPVVTYPDRWDTNSNVIPLLKASGWGVSFKGEADLGGVQVSNLTAYREATYFNSFDYDGTPLPITSVEINQDDEQFSNELQFSSSGDGPLQWVAGLYYYHSEGAAVPITVNLFDSAVIINITGLQKADSYSPYAQLTYALSDQFNLTLGGRYTWEKRTLVAATNQSTTFKDPSFRVALDYKPTPDTLLYVSANRGVKSGGFNVTDPVASIYRPEELTAYEFGQKAELFGRTVRLSSAFFYYDYKDLQTQVALAAGTGFSNGDAEMYGWEVEATARVTPDFTLSGGFNLLHSEFTNYPNALIGTPGGGVPVTIGDVSGNNLPYAPEFTFNLNANYTIDLGEGELALNGAYLHSSSAFHEADNVLREPAYDLFNASAKYTLPGGHYFVRGFINNITNEPIRGNALTIPSGQQIQLMRAPRTFGLELGVEY